MEDMKLNFAIKLRQSCVIMVMTAPMLTIEWKDYITLRNIRQNSALCIQIVWINASMENIAHLPTLFQILRPDLSTRWPKMTTSICFTSRLNGALLIRSTTRLNVTMLITGKISEESQIFFLIITMNFVSIGRLELSLVSTKKVVYSKLLVSIHMDGKSKNSTLLFIRPSLVKIKSAHNPHSVLSIILNRNKDLWVKVNLSKRWFKKLEISLKLCLKLPYQTSLSLMSIISKSF